MSSTITSQPVAFHAAAKKVAAAAVAHETWPVAEVLALFELPFNSLLHHEKEFIFCHLRASTRRYYKIFIKLSS
jgi:hypothetical protein